MVKIGCWLVYALWYTLSLLPFKVLYLLSDGLFYLVYYVVCYRKNVVHKNMCDCFPEKQPDEIIKMEKSFYHWFCDYIVETIKMASMTESQMKRHMVFEGVDDIMAAQHLHDKTQCYVYLGHYGNWEWIASLPYWVPDDVLCGQIYHPLYNQVFNTLFLRVRGKFGGVSIAMKESLRKLVELRRTNQKTIIGFIADQSPKWNSIHHFCPFMHRETPFFIGTEKIGKRVDALFYFAHVTRPSRGYYRCRFVPMFDGAGKQLPDYEVTDCFAALLEKMINQAPSYWLWSHKRWKRTKEQWIARQEKMKNNKENE